MPDSKAQRRAGPGASALDAEALERLEAVRQNQEKSARILRAVLELLAEKGYLSHHALLERMRGDGG